MRSDHPFRRRTTALALSVGLLTTAAGPAAGPPADDAPVTVSDPLATGLLGPLGIAVDRGGTVYVAEVFGGQLTSIAPDGTTEILYADEETTPAGGIAVTEHKQRVLFTSVTGAVGPDQLPDDTNLQRLRRDGTITSLASLLAFEERANPDADQEYGFVDAPQACLDELPEEFEPPLAVVESNPYAVAVHREDIFVADAAGNTIVRVPRRGGELSTVAVLPPVPQEISAETAAALELPDCTIGLTYAGEPVPTDVEVGRDGQLYVTTLPGFPEAEGAAAVWRIEPWTGATAQLADGLTGAVDLAVAKDGTIYVAELFANRISVIRDGEVSTLVSVNEPAALEIGRDGVLYAAIDAFAEEGGSVVTIEP
jgi:hypothetical protein